MNRERRFGRPASSGRQLRVLPGQEIKKLASSWLGRKGASLCLQLESNASAVSDWSSNSAVRRFVPRKGSISGTFLIVVLPTSKSTDVQLAP